MPPAPTTGIRGYSADKVALVNRLRRIEGQLRGIRRMIDEERYCIDILTQVGAVNSALDGVSLGLLDGHVRHCIAKGDPTELELKASEVVEAIGAGAGRPHPTTDKAALGTRIERATQRAGRVIGMVESDRYCIDILHEINDVKRTLDAVALGLLDRHIRACMTSGDPEERDDKARELMAAVGRLVKTT